MRTQDLALPLGALALLISINGCNKSVAKPSAQPNPKIEAIRQADYPVTLAEVNQWYATPTPEENAATLYLEAFDALDSKSPGSPTQNKTALELLHKAALRKKCRYPIDLNKGTQVALTHLPKFKKAAQLLCEEASLRAAKGQMELTTQSLLDALRLARSLEAEPLLISHMILVASENVIQAALESILNRHAFTEEQLARLEAACQEAQGGLSITRCMAGERCSGMSFYQLTTPQQVELFIAAKSPDKNLDLEAYRKTPAYDADFNCYLDLMEEGINASTLPFPKIFDQVSAYSTHVREARSKGYYISGLLLPALDTAVERAAECAGKLRVTQVALAVERYRLAHQKTLPDGLSQLAPQFLSEIPADPFDGNPVRYQKISPAAFVVYSIGKDRNDDGGVPKPPRGKSEDGYDLAFVVRR